MLAGLSPARQDRRLVAASSCTPIGRPSRSSGPDGAPYSCTSKRSSSSWHPVSDAAERIGTAEAFFGGVEPAVPVVVSGAEQTVEHLLEVVAQLRAVLLVALAQHLLGEATEPERVVIGEGHAHAQRLPKGATVQGRYGGGQRVHRRATVDTNGLTLVAQIAGVAGDPFIADGPIETQKPAASGLFRSASRGARNDYLIWRTRRDSNPRPLPSEGSTLSS